MDDRGPARHHDLVLDQDQHGLAFETDDIASLFESLKERGVTDGSQQPTEHFYGTDMGIREGPGTPSVSSR